MIKYFGIMLIALSLIFTSCASQPPMVKFNSTERIQTIGLGPHGKLYVQKEHLIEQESLDNGLSEMKPAWSEEISSAQTSRKIGEWSFILQIGTLVGCLAAVEPTTTIAWCLGSIAFIFPGAYYRGKANEQFHSVVKEYNEDHQPPVISEDYLIRTK